MIGMIRMPFYTIHLFTKTLLLLILILIVLDIAKWMGDDDMDEEEDDDVHYVTTSIKFHQFYKMPRTSEDVFKPPGIRIAMEVDNPQEEFEQRPMGPERKLILVWNYYNKLGLLKAWCRVFAPVVEGRCSESRCQLTTNRSRVLEADAVIFHLPNLHWNNYRVPRNRSEHQLWILMSHESALTIMERTRNWGVFPYVNHSLLDDLGFNATMTFRDDSEIRAFMGGIQRLERPLTRTEVKRRYRVMGERMSFDNYTSQSFALSNDTRSPIVWFVSHCRTLSHREVMVNELSEYIGVDVYGRCGQYKCGGVRNFNVSEETLDDDPCFHLANYYYRFQLAIENSFCKDYITEKSFHALNQHTIPIVAYRPPDLRKLPPHSVINIFDFRSSRELAAHLYYLLSNKTAYDEYFEWRRYYTLHLNYGAPNPCDLCSKLHDDNFLARTRTKGVVNITRWLLHESDCMPAAGSMLPHRAHKALV